ncbi:MAG: FAD binding domain-containing protein [Candidatus Izemoplasmatales bacterium]
MEVKEYVVPKSVEKTYELLKENKANKLIAGGAWIKLSVKSVDKLVSLDNLELDYIKEGNSYIEIGAMTCLRKIEINKAIQSLGSGILSQSISHIMGINIRNIATIGGSIMGKYAFSDILVVLLVLDAKISFYKLGEISIYDFMEMKRIPEDILLNIRIDKQQKVGYFKKVCKTHLDFAMINIAITKNSVYKIAVGSRPSGSVLAINTANYLNSKETINEEVLNEAVTIALEEITVGSNFRASKDYREVLLGTYLKRGIREVSK